MLYCARLLVVADPSSNLTAYGDLINECILYSNCFGNSLHLLPGLRLLFKKDFFIFFLFSRNPYGVFRRLSDALNQNFFFLFPLDNVFVAKNTFIGRQETAGTTRTDTPTSYIHIRRQNLICLSSALLSFKTINIGETLVALPMISMSTRQNFTGQITAYAI